MVNLGDKVKDKISGFVGIATGRTEYMYGCVREGLRAKSPPQRHSTSNPPCFLKRGTAGHQKKAPTAG